MTDDLLRSDDQSQSEGESTNPHPQQAEAYGAEGAAVALGQAGATVTVTRPAPGQTVEIQATAGQTYVLNFAPGEAQVQIQGNNFILAFDDDGDGTADSQLVFLDLVSAAGGGDAPTFQIAGVDIGAEVLLGQALALAGEGEVPLDDVAAGPGGLSGGGSAYDDNLGSILDLLVAQGVIPPTILEFRLIELEDRITILDEAEGEIELSFRTETDGGEGSVNTWEGGFEDWQPDQDGCDPAEFPMQVIIGFTPADNEELVSFRLSGIPDGAKFFVGGVEVPIVGGNTPLLTPADLAAGLTLLPPKDSGDDIPLTVTATIVDPDSGDTAVLTGSATAIIDSVADNPFAKFDGEADGGEGGCVDDCEVIVSSVTYNEDNAEHEVCEPPVQVFTQGGDYGGGCGDCGDDKLPIFGAGFTAKVTDSDGSESLTKITVTTTNECWPTDPYGLEIPLSATDDDSKTNFMIGDQVLVDGQTVNVWAKYPDGTWDFATADIDITDGVLTLTFAPELRVQEVDLSGSSSTPFQVRLPQHSDDDFQLNLEVTAQEYVIDGELTLDNNEATHQAVLNVEVKAVADGAKLMAGTEGEGFAEDDETDPANHGENSGETGLIIPLSSLGAQLIDKDGSEAITELKITLEGADAGAAFVDALGNPLGATLQVEVADGVFLTADVSISGTTLTLTFGDDAAGYDIDVSNLIHVQLPVDDSTDFTVKVQATTTEVNPEGDVACETKTTETSFDVHVGGVAGPAAVVFGDYSNIRGCCDPTVDGNTLTLSVFEDGVGTVHGQEGAGPLVVPVFFTAATQDSDGSEKITKVVLSLDGAPEGAAFTDSLGELLTEGQEIAGGTVSFVDGQLVITFPGAGADPIDLAGIGVKLPLHSDDDFSIKIVTTTTEYDDDGEGALIATHETDAFINVKVDAVADPVTVTVDAESANGDEAFAPGEAGTVKVTATFADLDGSEAHTVTLKVPAGFTVLDTDGGVQDGDTITWSVSGQANFEANLSVKANDDLTEDESVKWKAKAKAVETNENTDPSLGDAECTTENNTAVDFDKDKVTLDPALPPEVAVLIQGDALCIEEDGEGQFAVKVDALGDDFVSQIKVDNLPTGWGVSITGDDGGSMDYVTGIYTTSGNPATVTLTVLLTPPADSDVDVATLMGADITFTATAEDPESGDSAESAPVVADVNVDAVADPVTVDLTVNDNPIDEGNQFSPSETGSVNIKATFGDATDGSETHTVTVEIPDGFTVGALDGLPFGVTAGIVGGNVVFTLGNGVTSLDYTFQVTAPADGIEDHDLFQFKAVAKAEETPDDAECDLDNNIAEADDLAMMYGEAVGEPEVGLAVRGEDGVKEDHQTDIAISANVTTDGDTLTQVVVTAPTGWVLNAVAGGDIASVVGDGTTSLILTLNPGVTNFSSVIQATPPQDTDIDATFTVTATAVDGLDSSEGSSDFPVIVDAILDHALELGADGAVSGDEAVGEQTFGLGLDSSVINPFLGSNDGGADTDGSETTTVTLTLNVALPDGATLSSTGGTVTQDLAGDPSGKTYTITGDLEAIIDGLQVTLPGGFEGLISGTITTESREANTPQGTVGGSGLEPDETDNVSIDSVDFAVRIAGGKVEPSAAIGLPEGTAAIKEDSENNQVNFSASADNLTDELTSILIELPNVASGDVDVAQITADLVGIGSVLVSEAGGTTTITITFNDASDVQSFSSSFTLDAPDEDSDVDLTGVKITANAKDITDPSATGFGEATTTIVVDAVLDEAGSATQGMAPSETESDAPQEIDLNLSLGFVPAGFLLSGAGGEDTDGSEAITSVTVTISTGALELGDGAPAGSSLTHNGGGNYTLNVLNPADYANAIAALQVEVPGGYEGTVTGSISVTTQEVSPNGGETDFTDNSKTITNTFSATVNGGPVVPTAALALAGGAAAIKEDSTDNVVNFSASANNLTDELTTVVIELPNVATDDIDIAQILSDLGANGTASVTAPGGLTTITITFNDASDVQSFSSSFTLDAPDEDSDVDLTGVKITANAKDITDPSAIGSDDATTTIVVDAILDTAIELGANGATGGSESDSAQTFGLGLNSSFVGPFAGSGAGGADTDGSETTTVTLTLDAALPDGATLTSTGGTVTPTGNPLVFTITGANLEQAIDGLQVNLPAGFEGVISGTVTTTSTEANTPQGAVGASGQEPDVSDNTRSDSVNFTVTVTGGGVTPTAAIGLPDGVAAIKEDSENNQVTFSASANNLTDELTTVVIELPNVAVGDIDIAQILSDLGANGTASVTAPGGLTTITITFNDASDVQSFSSSFTLDAPDEDSDVDLANVKITANAKDITDPLATGFGEATTTIVVDAVLDEAGSATQGAAPSEAESDAPQEIDLNLSLGFVPAGFLLSGAGGEDTDGSEAVTSVTVTISTGVLELGDGAPAGSSLTHNGGGNYTLNVLNPADYAQAVAALQVEVPGGFEGAVTGSISVTTQEVSPNGGETDFTDNSKTITNTFSATVNGGPVVPTAALGLAGGGDCIKEDSVDNEINFSASSGDSSDELTTVVIELPGLLEGHIGGLDFGVHADKVASFDISDDGTDTTITITLNPGVESLEGSFTLDAPVANSDVDITGITITANAQDKTDNAKTGSDVGNLDIHVDAVVDGSQVTQTVAAEGNENDPIDLNLAIDLGGDSTTGPGESQGGTDTDGSESVTQVVVTLSHGTLGWTLPGAMPAPVQDPAGTWTFNTAGASLADVQSLVDSLKVTPPAGFDGNIGVTVTTTTAEAATEAGPNGASGEECTNANNVDVDSYNFTVTVNPTVLPPVVDVQLEGNAACIKEDGSVEFDIVVSAQNGTDDVVNTVSFHQFKALMTAGWGVVVSDNGAGGSFDGDFSYTADGVDQSVTFTVTLTPPADSDLDVHSVLGADLAVSATAKDGTLVSDVAGPVVIDVNVDAVADGVDGSNGDDGDAANLSVSLSVVDSTGETPENGVFQVGEVGKLTVSATFDDYQDGSETHTVTVTAPTGFTLGGVIGALPAGVSVVSNTGTVLVLSVDSKDGDGQDGVGSFTAEFAVTNTSADDGVAQFSAEAKAVETSTGDVECDPSAADNVAVATDFADVTVEDAKPVIVAASASLLDEDDLVPDGSDQAAEPTGDRIDEGTIEVDFSNDQPANLLDAFAFTGGVPANGPNGDPITYTPSGDGNSLTASIDGVDIFTVTITGVVDNGGGNVTYNYSVELLAEMDHLTGPNGENSFGFTPEFTVTDSDGDPVSGDFTVTVVDDVPDAVDDEVCVQENAPVSYDLMFVLDISLSMDAQSGIEGLTRLEAAGEALKQLIDAYFAASDNVSIQLATFSTSATAIPGTFTTAQDAKAAVDEIVNDGPVLWTNYEAALEVTQANWSPSPATASHFNTVYFLSDGEPTQGDVSAADVQAWEDFLDSHGANAIAVGVGSGIDAADADLAEVAYPNDTSPIIVHDFAALADALVATVPPQNSVSGNVIHGADGLPNTGDAGEDSLGADGLAQILSVTYGTETFDVSGGSLVSSGADAADASYNDTTKILTITTGNGVLEIQVADTLDGKAGDYSYTPNAPVVHGAPGSETDDVVEEVFTYVVADGDGDETSADLTICIEDGVPTATAATVSATVEEEHLPGGNEDTLPGADQDTPGNFGQTTASASGNLGSLVDFGSDGPGGFSLDVIGTPIDSGLTSGGQTVWYVSDGTVLTAFVDNGTTGGGLDASDKKIFELSVSNTAYNFVLLGQIDHAADDLEDVIPLDFSSYLQAQDGDGDIVSFPGGTFVINVIDDVPEDIQPHAVVVGSNAGPAATAALGFYDAVGTDKPGDVVFDSSLQDATLMSGGDKVTSNGKDILLDISDAGHTLTGYVESGANAGFQEGEDSVILTVELNPDADNQASDLYTVTVTGPIDTGAAVLFDNFGNINSGGPKDFIALDDPRTGGNDLGEDVLITASPEHKQVNASTQGAGVGSQNVDAGETIRVDFVKNVVGLTDGTPQIKANFGSLTYSGHYTVNDSGFTLSQVISGAASINVKALDADDDKDFGGDLQDVQRNITLVTVLNASGVVVINNAAVDTTVGSITVDFKLDGTVDISGLLEGYRVLVSTVSGFDALEIKGLSAKFDLGGITTRSIQAGDPIDLSFGVDVIDADGDTADGTINVTVLPQLQGTAAAEQINATANGSFVLAGDGNDSVEGSSAADKLLGEGGNDDIDGNAGDDTLDGGSGNDTLDGDGGNDLLYGGAGADDIDGDGGNDTLYGGDGNDTLDGGSSGDVLFGDGGNDLLYGGDSGDFLFGGEGNDTLYGGSGSDMLDGGSGADILYGGGGSDVLTGGTDADTFVFAYGGSFEEDYITDFNLADGDKLDLSDLLSGESANAANLDSYLNISTVGANTVINIETDGSGSFDDFRIVLEGVSLDGNGSLSDQQVIQNLLTGGNLVVD